MRCDDVSLLLSESAEASATLPRSIARHAEHCLRCQAEQAQYRRIRRTMISMRGTIIDPGPSMVGEVMGLVRDGGPTDDDGRAVDRGWGDRNPGDRHPGDRRRAAYVAAAAATATAAGALVLAARSKRPVS